MCSRCATIVFLPWQTLISFSSVSGLFRRQAHALRNERPFFHESGQIMLVCVQVIKRAVAFGESEKRTAHLLVRGRLLTMI